MGKSWTVLKLLEVRHPEDAQARALARERLQAEKRKQALDAHMAGLRASWAVVDEKLLHSLDYDRAGEIEKLRGDTRPLATIKGAAPVTVADLTAGVNQRFFHGIENAVAGKKVNREKEKILEDVLNRRVVEREGTRLGLERSSEYKDTVSRKQAGMLFEAFVQKAIVPDVKVEDRDLETYVAAHRDEFTEPETMTLESLAFSQRKDAEEALAKLQKGASFGWLRTNAAGLADPHASDAAGIPRGPVTADALPEGVRKALAGAREGDYRFWGEGAGPFLVVHLVDHAPASPLPLESVRDRVRGLVYQEKLGKIVDDWGARLRKASDVRRFATGDELGKLVLKDMSTER